MLQRARGLSRALIVPATDDDGAITTAAPQRGPARRELYLRAPCPLATAISFAEAMSENELPLFPLPIVLFPGTPQPLHVFEPRYRQLLADCLDGDRRFGLSVVHPENGGGEAPQPGEVGCSTIIRSHNLLPDGRSNILVVGEQRYVFKRLLERDRLYLVGRVEFFHDCESHDSDLPSVAARVRKLFTQLVNVSQELGTPSDPLGLPDDPELLSYHVAAALEIDLAAKENLLRLTSTKIRLEQLRDLLKPAIVRAARRSSVRRVAKGNGKGAGIPPPIPSTE